MRQQPRATGSMNRISRNVIQDVRARTWKQMFLSEDVEEIGSTSLHRLLCPEQPAASLKRCSHCPDSAPSSICYLLSAICRTLHIRRDGNER